MLIGTSMPETRPGGWVMTIRPDTIKAIQTAWPNLIAGQGGQNVQSPLGIAEVTQACSPRENSASRNKPSKACSLARFSPATHNEGFFNKSGTFY